MDMSSLSSGLPRPKGDPITIAFKDAALSLTTLYKASQHSRQAGYVDAIDDIYRLFMGQDSVDVETMRHWLDDRRRKESSSDAEDSFSGTTGTAAASAPGTVFGHNRDVFDFDTEPVVRPAEPSRRHVASPSRRFGRQDSGDVRETTEQRREKNGVKRRVLAATESVFDNHKRSRFGQL